MQCKLQKEEKVWGWAPWCAQKNELCNSACACHPAAAGQCGTVPAVTSPSFCGLQWIRWESCFKAHREHYLQLSIIVLSLFDFKKDKGRFILLVFQWCFLAKYFCSIKVFCKEAWFKFWIRVTVVAKKGEIQESWAVTNSREASFPKIFSLQQRKEPQKCKKILCPNLFNDQNILQWWVMFLRKLEWGYDETLMKRIGGKLWSRTSHCWATDFLIEKYISSGRDREKEILALIQRRKKKKRRKYQLYLIYNKL